MSAFLAFLSVRTSQHVCFCGLLTNGFLVLNVMRDFAAADFLGRNALGHHFSLSLSIVIIFDPFYQRDKVRLSVPVVYMKTLNGHNV